MKVLYDPECHKLATYFLEEYPLVTGDDINELAGVIQQAIEGWMTEKGID